MSFGLLKKVRSERTARVFFEPNMARLRFHIFENAARDLFRFGSGKKKFTNQNENKLRPHFSEL
ncbi:hypothetical protein CLI80_00150 [Porphyromonas gingivalis]|nr:hypothetical protein CLI80_00150 [Porphyromonas gingivalis]